jgi:hypothetical protein
MIELFAHGSQTGFDIPETFPVSELSKSHAEILIQAGKASYSVIAVVSLDAIAEFVHWQEVHQLSKNYSSGIHWLFLSV